MTTTMSRSHTPPSEETDGPSSEQLALAFAPLHKRAFGIAIGAAMGLTFFLITAVFLLRGGLDRQPRLELGLLDQYFYGYSVSWPGAFVGLVWGVAVGFVAGWFFAFCRNLALAVTLVLLRAKAEMSATRDFLDHI
jgi:hypothetical protein